jgi:hypothetical protein
MSEDNLHDDAHQSRIRLVRDVVVFQFKLAADGLRDILLSPVSIAAAILGLVAGGDEPERYFRRLQRFGRRTDIWINLFSQYRHGPTADRFLEPFERKVIEEYERGGWLSDGTNRLNKALDHVGRRPEPGKPTPTESAPDDGVP